jgi:putative ABC transport system permease protein
VYGGDPAVIGRTITARGDRYTVIGVMPEGFGFPERTDIWTPLMARYAGYRDTAFWQRRDGRLHEVIARLKEGVTIEQASQEINAIAQELGRQYPATNADVQVRLTPLREAETGAIRPYLMLLLPAVLLVLLIGCVNAANLLLARASAREKEIAIRTALGAGRRRLARQMLVESLILALAGGTFGLLLAYWALAPIRTLSAGSIPRVADISIDATVLAFAFGVSVLTGIIFGLAPAWQAVRGGVAGVLKEGGRSSATAGGRWVRSGLLVTEVALSIVLLVGATLLLRSFDRLTNVDPGFRADRVLAFRVSLPNATYREEHNRIAFFDNLLGKLDALPQITAAGMVQTLPMRGDYFLSFTVQGRPAPKPAETPSANHRVVSPGYFTAMGIPLLRGRAFTERDREKAPMVAMVDEAFVKRHFPNEEPIGRGIDIGNGTDGFYEIVGVVGSVHYAGLDANPLPTMYVPYPQDVFSTMWVVARSEGDPAQISSAARQAVREVDPGLPAYSLSPLENIVTESVAERRFSMLLLGLFAMIALFLAAVGLYGVVAYTVSQRTQEIGVRLAIGAQRSDVLGLVVGGGLKLALAGVAIGLVAAMALARLLEKMLFEVSPSDPASYLATSLVLLAVAAIACYIPARRATRVDPIVALRQE